MKNKAFTLVLLTTFTTASFMLTSCEKGEDTPAAPTNTELLARSSWKFSAATVSGSDVSAFLQTCQKDNTMLFSTTGTGSADEGTTKCNGTDPQTTPFTWNYNSGETLLHISAILFTGGSSDFTLISLSGTQLVLSQVITVGGTPQNAVVTFIH